jgi:peptidoglycan/xylan/chitin deacetylase (PgdA/CDA1 family)
MISTWRPRSGFLWLAMAVALGSVGYSSWCWLTPEVAVLCLHAVEDSDPQMAPWAISASRLEEILALLEAGSRRSLTLQELPEYLHGAGWTWAPQRYLLTFDDGRKSDAKIVIPACKRRGIPAVFFVPSLPGVRRLSRETLVGMKQQGFEIGAHSQRHGSFLQARRESALAFRDRLRQEVSGSRQDLAEILGEAPVAFAYPGGDAPIQAVEAVSGAGYSFAFTTDYGYVSPSSDPLRLPRLILFSSTEIGEVEEFLEGPRRNRLRQLTGSVVIFGLAFASWLWLQSYGQVPTSSVENP